MHAVINLRTPYASACIYNQFTFAFYSSDEFSGIYFKQSNAYFDKRVDK